MATIVWESVFGVLTCFDNSRHVASQGWNLLDFREWCGYAEGNIYIYTHTHVHVHDSKQDPFEAFC